MASNQAGLHLGRAQMNALHVYNSATPIRAVRPRFARAAALAEAVDQCQRTSSKSLRRLRGS